MDENKEADLEAAPAAEEPSPEEQDSSKDPIEAEIGLVERKEKTKLEKLVYTKERVDKQIAEEKQKLGIEDDDMDVPLTKREYNAIKFEESRQEAVDLSDSIEDDNERKLVKYHLEHTIRPTGDPQTDLRNARLLVNGVKNGQQLEEIARARTPRASVSSPSAPPRGEVKDDLTPEEKNIMKGFGLTKEKVLAARPKE